MSEKKLKYGGYDNIPHDNPWGWDTGAILYKIDPDELGDQNTKIIQNYPDLYQQIKDLCKEYFENRE